MQKKPAGGAGQEGRGRKVRDSKARSPVTGQRRTQKHGKSEKKRVTVMESKMQSAKTKNESPQSPKPKNTLKSGGPGADAGVGNEDKDLVEKVTEAVGLDPRGGPREKLSPENVEKIQKFFRAGATVAQIESVTPWSKATISKYTQGIEQEEKSEADSFGPKSLSEVPTASITAATPRTGERKKPEATKQLRFEDTLPALGRPPFTDSNGEAEGYGSSSDEAGKRKIDPAEQGRWNRLMLFLYSEAFRGGWDSVEDYVSKEVLPQVRFAKSIQDIVKPLVTKRDAKGRPDPHEMFETTMSVIEEGMDRITLRLKMKKELEDKMNSYNGGDG